MHWLIRFRGQLLATVDSLRASLPVEDAEYRARLLARQQSFPSLALSVPVPVVFGPSLLFASMRTLVLFVAALTTSGALPANSAPVLSVPLVPRPPKGRQMTHHIRTLQGPARCRRYPAIPVHPRYVKRHDYRPHVRGVRDRGHPGRRHCRGLLGVLRVEEQGAGCGAAEPA